MEIKTDKWSNDDLEILAKITFPTKSDTAKHYPFYFTGFAISHFWRVFKPSFPIHHQQKFISYIKRKYGFKG